MSELRLKIFITGVPGVGKTTVVQKVIAILKEKELKVGGISCPEIRVNNIRVGFEKKNGVYDTRDWDVIRNWTRELARNVRA